MRFSCFIQVLLAYKQQSCFRVPSSKQRTKPTRFRCLRMVLLGVLIAATSHNASRMALFAGVQIQRLWYGSEEAASAGGSIRSRAQGWGQICPTLINKYALAYPHPVSTVKSDSFSSQLNLETQAADQGHFQDESLVWRIDSAAGTEIIATTLIFRPHVKDIFSRDKSWICQTKSYGYISCEYRMRFNSAGGCHRGTGQSYVSGLHTTHEPLPDSQHSVGVGAREQGGGGAGQRPIIAAGRVTTLAEV